MAAAPDNRRWVAAGVAAVVLVFLLERLTSANVALVTLAAGGPLIAAVGGSLRATIAVAALAVALALLELSLAGPFGLQDAVRLLTVLVVSTLAVVLAALRGRLVQATAEARAASRTAEETLALLDVIFDRAPVGLAFHDLDGRYVRINDHLAEINGRTPGRARRPHARGDAAGRARGRRRGRRVAASGEPVTAMEVRGETPARPGVQREWIASVWPVRAALGGALLGVGTVVFEVTDRRAAERALRTQTDRYETLLAALSEVGEGMVVIEDGRCVYANHAFEQLSGYTFPELTALESLYEIVEPDERAEAERRVRLRWERDLVDTGLHRPHPPPRRRLADARAGRRPARDRRAAGAAPARRGGARHHRPAARRGRARAAARPLRAAGRGERAVRPVARRGAHAAQHRRAVRARPRGHVRGRARRLPGAGAAARGGRARPRGASRRWPTRQG